MNEVLSLTFTWPTGRVEQVAAVGNEYGYAEMCLVVMPDEPMGEYLVTVQGVISSATGTFTVKPATYPTLRIVPEYGPPGTTFKMGLAGFDPGENVPLSLFREPPRSSPSLTRDFLGSLPPVQVDELGQWTTTLVTRTDDPEGIYVVEFGEDTVGYGERIELATSPRDRTDVCYAP